VRALIDIIITAHDPGARHAALCLRKKQHRWK